MKKIIAMISTPILLLSLTLSAEDLNSILASATVKAEDGKLIVTSDGKNVSLAGHTPTKNGNKYFYSSIYFKTPLDLKGKKLEFDASSKFPQNTQAVYLRFFNNNESKPTWAFFSWNFPLTSRPRTFSLSRYQDGKLNWESASLGPGDPAAITRLQIWIGTNLSAADIEITLSNFKMSGDNDALNWTPQPAYADHAAVVQHPAGPIKTADIERGRTNVQQFDWAKRQLASYRDKSKILMALDPQNLDSAIPAENPWLQCPCPKCGEHADRAWSKGLNPDGQTVTCSKCGQVLPSAAYPEDHRYTATDSHGRTRIIKYHEGKQPYYGNLKQHITGLINWLKVARLYKLQNLGYVYGLTGEMAYARQVRQLLLRFAEVYPGYVVRFRTTAYATPRECNMASKVADWKFQDSCLVANLAIAYDLTVNSGLYSAADRKKIENGIFREYQWLITAHAPTSDWCSNAVPAHLTAAALCAAMTGDHPLMSWVLEGSEGFKAFIEHNYHRDGFWNENSASYAVMANDPLIQLIETLQGYSDAPEYRQVDRYDRLNIFQTVPGVRNIFSCESKTVMPDGNLPATNDSCFGEKLPQAWLEFTYYHFPTPEHLALLQGGLAAADTSEYSLFKRQTQLPKATPEQRAGLYVSHLISGPCWGVLRPDNGKNDTALLFNYGPFTGGHAHNSALNFSYYDFNRELITDLGYMRYTHPLRPWMISALAHNLVIVDGKPQSDQRNPRLRYYHAATDVKVIDAEAPECYPNRTTEYRRTMLLLPLGGDRYYVADFFWVKGGRDHLYAIHGDSAEYATNLSDGEWKETTFSGGDADLTGRKWLEEIKTATAPEHLIMTWRSPSKVNTRLFWCKDHNDQRLYIAKAPGTRDPNQPYDRKSRIAVFLAQAATTESNFAAVLEASRDPGQITQVKALTLRRGIGKALTVTFGDHRDVIIVNHGKEPVELEDYPAIRLDGAYGVVRMKNRQVSALFLGNGRSLSAGKAMIENAENANGKVVAIDGPHQTIEVKMTAMKVLTAGNYLIFPQAAGAYRIAGVNVQSGKTMITLAAEENINFKQGDRFVVFNAVEKQY